MASQRASAGPRERRRRRVLVVEDHPGIARVVAAALRRDGYEVVIAEDGEVGLFLARTESYDAVVLDLNLPGRSGLELLAGIAAERPVVVLTCNDDPRTRQRCLELGARCFMTKPFAVTELCASVRAGIEGRPS